MPGAPAREASGETVHDCHPYYFGIVKPSCMRCAWSSGWSVTVNAPTFRCGK